MRGTLFIFHLHFVPMPLILKLNINMIIGKHFAPSEGIIIKSSNKP